MKTLAKYFISQNGRKPTLFMTSFTKYLKPKTPQFLFIGDSKTCHVLRAWTAHWCNQLRSYAIAKTHDLRLISKYDIFVGQQRTC